MIDNCPLISIITVTFNAAGCIASTLESVASQSMRDFEHLIIDGASSDSTLDIVRRLSSDAVIYSEPDTGIYDGMNKGLRLARGRYVLFLNAGDSFADSSVLADYAAAIRACDCDIVYADTDIVDAAGHFLRHRHLSAPEILTPLSFSRGMLICHQAFMMRRDKAPTYNLAYRLSADFDWTIRCIKATTPGRCRNIHRVAIHYLDDGASEKHKLRSLLERFRIMTLHYGWFTAIRNHLGFIPRAIRRNIGKKRK